MSVGNLAVVIPDVAERMMFYHPFVHQITSLFSGGGDFSHHHRHHRCRHNHTIVVYIG